MIHLWTTSILLFLAFGLCSANDTWDNLDLFEEHVPYFFYNNPDLKKQCLNDSKCTYQKVYDYNLQGSMTVIIQLNTGKEGTCKLEKEISCGLKERLKVVTKYVYLFNFVDGDKVHANASRFGSMHRDRMNLSSKQDNPSPSSDGIWLLQEKKADKCWGYETNCPKEEKVSNIDCPLDSKGWTTDKYAQKEFFWTAGDFGYVKQRKEELKSFCTPQQKGDSSLECSQFLRYCRAENIYLDFRKTNLKSGHNRYREDLFQKNEIGGHCNLHSESLKAEAEHKSPLQSWFAELENYSSLKFRPTSQSHCDVIIDKPTFFVKLDVGINLYHHFCDFINLYITQHMNNSFSSDVYIVMWDTSEMNYGDIFKVTWKAFSKHEIIPLNQFDGKRICIKDAVFSFLPRMRYGLYYNMPLVPGCKGSSLVRAFSQHVLHRLNVTQEGPLPEKIRVTLLSRSTKFRRILNEEELISALKTITEFDVQLVDFDARSMSFQDQLKVSLNSDIFIGMHGAGLTHTLFLPDWGVLFELYNCEDEYCFKDLTNLRGVKYLTWQDKSKLVQEDEGHHPTLGAHAKFTNYSFEIREFIRLILQAADYVLGHPDFWNGYARKYQSKSKTEL